MDCRGRHNAPSRAGHCKDPCKDIFLRNCFVQTELLKMEKTLQPRKGTRPSALLPPSVCLSCPTKCAPCPAKANNHYENPCLSMSCATNIHMRRGFPVEFEFHLPLCDVFFPTLLLSPRACLQSAALCTPHGLSFICKKYGKGSGKHHTRRNHTPMHALFCCACHVYMLCFPLCSFATTYAKAFRKYHKVGKTVPFPYLVHEHMEKPAPPRHMSCVM